MDMDKFTHEASNRGLLGTAHDRLNAEFSISLRMSHLLCLIVFGSFAIGFSVRYRLTRNYSRLSKELDTCDDEDQSIAADMWKDVNYSDSESSDRPPSSHFDEFLKAIKVFGFLEHDVFNELTKSTQTLRIQNGEMVQLEKLGGFAVVINGAMKVYCKSLDGEGNIREIEEQAGDPWKGYDLLNEINVSAPISSLSSILSLFSDSIQDNTESNEFDKVNATVVAVASEPSTIVVIPAAAFKDLTRKFPHAAANIVQIILFRWSQVTVRTCQRYLNLTQHFYDTERSLNRTSRARIEKWLPKWMIENVVKRMQALGAESNKDECELKSLVSRTREASQASIDLKKFGSSAKLSKLNEHGGSISHDLAHSVELGDDSYRSSEFPGDLLSHAALNFHTSKNPGGSLNLSFLNLSEQKPTRKPPSRDTEESALRRAIAETMFSTIMFDSPLKEETDETRKEARDLKNDMQEAVKDVSAILSEQKDAEHSDTTPKDDASPQKDDNNSPKGHRNRPRFDFPRSASFMLNSRNKHSEPAEIRVEDAPPASYNEVLDDASEVLELVWYRKGEYISKYGERSRGLIYVLDGLLEVGYYPSNGNILKHSHNKSYQSLYEVGAGNITGFLETISSYSSFVDLIAKKDTCVAIISKTYFDRLAEAYPLLYITAAKALTTSLTRPIVQLDFALEWISIKSGDRLIRQGQNANAIYFVLNGRVRAYENNDLVGDYGHGSTIGELETMSGEQYQSSVYAVRDTELSRFPKTLVECLARQHPSVTFEMSKMVVQAMRVRNNLRNSDPISVSSDFKTLAILRTSDGLPVEDFAMKLCSAFEELGKSVMVLTHAVIMRYLGTYAFHRMGSLKLKAYLADLEERNDLLLYVADGASSSQWSRTCVDQADCVLLLADGSEPPVFSDIERVFVKSATRSRSQLILLHNEQNVPHGSTAKWLKHRPWISAHHHIQMQFVNEHRRHHNDGVGGELEGKSRVQRKIRQIKNRVKERVQDELPLLQQMKLKRKEDSDISMAVGVSRLSGAKNDFNRLARLLAGEAIGVVLGGGGARGLSHIGVLQALEEAGVPIDLVGGTSIGSLVGGLYAKEYNVVPIIRKAKQFSVRVSSFWRVVLDLTYPMMAWTTGHAFNRAVWKSVGDSRIEDFWVRFFTNTTNLTLSRMEIHDRGYAWRFIRASMSLAGLVPPLEEKGEMLLDGGYVDNLPVTKMKKMGARYIVAVDVGAVDDTTPMQYGDTLSGFGALLNKYNPFSAKPNVPDLAEIQQRLTYVSSVKALEEAKNAKGVLYLRPPIDNYATLDFSKFDEIRKVGFTYTKPEIAKRIAKGELPTIHSRSNRGSSGVVKFRRYSF